MVIDELLKIGMSSLKGSEFSNSPLETRLILSKLLKVDKSYIYAHGEMELSQDIVYMFLKLIQKRSEGYPFQYIVQEKEFMGLDFYIEEGVLVPRPDTEVLVEYIIDYINKNYEDEPVKVLDLGIGSGAISIAIAYYCSNTQVYGVDIGDTPIKVANINKERFNLSNVEFLQGDMFQAIDILNIKDGFHIIASNPPYIPKSELDKLQVEVKDYEPRLALEGGEDGLMFYRQISSKAGEYLCDGGLLIYEIGFDQAQAVREILVKEGFKDIEILKDLQGLDRVVVGLFNKEV